MYAAPLGELGRGPAAGGAVIVAGTTAEIEETLDTTRRFVLLASVAAALLAAALATLLARRALRPLRRLSSGARAIERTGDPSQRLPDPHARDEVGTLAETLNAMLASLERAREAEQRFVGDASHELRTPLTALRGNLAYVTRHGADPDVLEDIAADAARLGDLLDDLLALAREDAAAPARAEPVDLAEVAREAAADHVLAPDSLVVLGERPALERAVDNLVRNARRHGSGAVTVTRRARRRPRAPERRDEGPGLTPEQAEHAFERFWRGRDAAVPGSGSRPRDRARHRRAPRRRRDRRRLAFHDRSPRFSRISQTAAVERPHDTSPIPRHASAEARRRDRRRRVAAVRGRRRRPGRHRAGRRDR